MGHWKRRPFLLVCWNCMLVLSEALDPQFNLHTPKNSSNLKNHFKIIFFLVEATVSCSNWVMWETRWWTVHLTLSPAFSGEGRFTASWTKNSAEQQIFIFSPCMLLILCPSFSSYWGSLCHFELCLASSIHPAGISSQKAQFILSVTFLYIETIQWSQSSPCSGSAVGQKQCVHLCRIRIGMKVQRKFVTCTCESWNVFEFHQFVSRNVWVAALWNMHLRNCVTPIWV